MNQAAEITRRAKSNLAFALSVLPPERRADATTYYAFCRTLDDMADDPVGTSEARAEAIRGWKYGLEHGFVCPAELQREMLDLKQRHSLPTEWLVALADGCIQDLSSGRYETWEDLDKYIWKVAGSVGLVSARLFGCDDPVVDRYAEMLGRALQLTNILRDVGEDWTQAGRLYLPLEAMRQHGLVEQDLVCGSRAIQPLLCELADRADHAFAEASRLLPRAAYKPMLPARIMAAIYQDLLRRMRSDGLRVMEKRYRVPLWRKLWLAFLCRFAG